jgi:radical SAM enzyme (TIGR01210 family)
VKQISENNSSRSTNSRAAESLLRDGNSWIAARRGERNPVDPWRPYHFLVEPERSQEGAIVDIATIFLTNRECPWRCLMCDLWKNTTEETVPRGAIPAQLQFALSQLPPASQVKLYNSGSFFDPNAIPIEEWPSIAEQLKNFDRIIVECHPSLIRDRILPFRDLLAGKLEVAMGLETANPEVLGRLNKRMSVEDFACAADFLHQEEIALRVFVLVFPPFQPKQDQLFWSNRSVEFAFDCHASAVSLIPTRLGNGALDALAQEGAFSPPSLSLFEEAFDDAFLLQRGRVFADTWDLQQFSRCPDCLEKRRTRLERMNLSQKTEPRIHCSGCSSGIPGHGSRL